MSDLIADRVSSLLTSFLDVQSRRAQVVAGNIANAETPGYTAKELEFADYLQRAAQETVAPAGNQGLLSERGPRMAAEAGNPVGIDGNNVDLGREMTTLADAGMQYLFGTQLLQSRLRTLRAAIKEGR